MACPGNRRPWPRQDLENLKRWAGKVPAPVMAEEFGRTHKAVKEKAKVLGVSLFVPGCGGGRHWKFKWTPELRGQCDQ
ncbi:hypothetical protein PU634_10475 [Oceanimonas pelagia]|uniref:Uncharacterized protein n=1 Tax=Oceanimonas pelagia TaxID=3028314 RepID=A0AA50KJZ7_9GAMM|nr:hypothetical protein [Oceanimonas pelagia]WMC09541.1 hypothetical protein PU634_10475 [Oceanimonas pelagia]